jgi:hypothetical protein
MTPIVLAVDVNVFVEETAVGAVLLTTPPFISNDKPVCGPPAVLAAAGPNNMPPRGELLRKLACLDSDRIDLPSIEEGSNVGADWLNTAVVSSE